MGLRVSASSDPLARTDDSRFVVMFLFVPEREVARSWP